RDDADTPVTTVDADEDGAFLVRLQPELLRAVRYEVAVEAGASLGFPVAGRDARATESFWGDSRDAGARRHEGIDIFAPRGTPAVAAVTGIITRVDDTKIGGRVVWLLDAATNQHLYYAHLDRHLVHAGQQVPPCDTVGLSGHPGQ